MSRHHMFALLEHNCFVAIVASAVLTLLIIVVRVEKVRVTIVTSKNYPATNSTNRHLLSFISPKIEEIRTSRDDREMAEVFERRRRQVRSACRRNFDMMPERYTPITNFKTQSPYQFILLDDEHKILFCSVPKVASTNWRRFFVQLGTNNPNLQMAQEAAHSINATWPYLKPLSSYSNEEYYHLAKKIKSYKKMIWVRNPLRRLLSAWHDKLQNKNEFYWKIHGSAILKRYDNEAGEAKIAEGGPVPLQHFLHYLADRQNSWTDIHWERYFKLCLPCHIDYDYIGHLEGGDAEANFVIKQTTGQSKILFPSTEARSYLDDNYLLNGIPREVLAKVLHRYSTDFDMFDYPTPKI